MRKLLPFPCQANFSAGLLVTPMKKKYLGLGTSGILASKPQGQELVRLQVCAYQRSTHPFHQEILLSCGLP